jgi:hypothetical protein
VKSARHKAYSQYNDVQTAKLKEGICRLHSVHSFLHNVYKRVFFWDTFGHLICFICPTSHNSAKISLWLRMITELRLQLRSKSLGFMFSKTYYTLKGLLQSNVLISLCTTRTPHDIIQKKTCKLKGWAISMRIKEIFFFNTVKKTINTCKYKGLSDVIAKEYGEIVIKSIKQSERVQYTPASSLEYILLTKLVIIHYKKTTCPSAGPWSWKNCDRSKRRNLVAQRYILKDLNRQLYFSIRLVSIECAVK